MKAGFYKSISISIPFQQLVEPVLRLSRQFYSSPASSLSPSDRNRISQSFLRIGPVFPVHGESNFIVNTLHPFSVQRFLRQLSTTVLNYNRHFPGGSVSKLSLLRFVPLAYINARKSFEMFGSIRDARCVKFLFFLFFFFYLETFEIPLFPFTKKLAWRRILFHPSIESQFITNKFFFQKFPPEEF